MSEAEQEENEKTTILNVKVRRKFLDEMQKAVETSDGKYPTKSELTRVALQEKITRMKKGESVEPESDDWIADEKSMKRGKTHEADVKKTLESIDDTFSFLAGFPNPFSNESDILIDHAKEDKTIGKTAVWSDPRVQKVLQEKLRDTICPEDSFWSDERNHDSAEAKEWTRALVKGLRIPNSAAANLVKAPGCKACKSCKPAKAEAEEGGEEESEEEEEEQTGLGV